MKARALLERQLGNLPAGLESLLREARIPGAGLAVVVDDRTVFARGFGYRDLRRKLAMTVDTRYPIASTTKAMNATLLGMLVEEGHLDWDAPVRTYLPQFRLYDEVVSSRVTLRDLVTMRTGLPRHDWVWWDNPGDRADLVASMAHLKVSTDFRTRLQYCNLSATAAGHVAEVVMRTPWETLIGRRLLRPLGMRETRCTAPRGGNMTLSYHEDCRRRLVRSRPCQARATAPSGGAIYSTIRDMARWIRFNLSGGMVGKRRLIPATVLEQIHTPQMIIGERPLALLPVGSSYALGWVIDSYRGYRRISHGGYLHDVNSFVMFFPELRTGMVAFTNFGAPRFAELMNQYAFDTLIGHRSRHAGRQRLREYEKAVEQNRRRNAAASRVLNTRPTHPLSRYCNTYSNAGYGSVQIYRRGRKLYLRRYGLRLPLRHWHYDAWIGDDHHSLPIHQPHAFDRAHPVQFHLGAGGEVSAVSIRFEPELPPIRFTAHNIR